MNKKLSVYLFPLLAFVLFGLTNCGLMNIDTAAPNLRVYEGPAHPKEQVGTLKRVIAMRIDEIDGLTYEEIKELSNFESYTFASNPVFPAWELLPGKHILKVSGESSPHPGLILKDEESFWRDQEEYTIKTKTYRSGLREFFHIKGVWEIEFTIISGQKYELQYELKEEEGLSGSVLRVYPYVIDMKKQEKVSTCKRLIGQVSE
ncbi:hypothetical protein ACFLRW_03505 [Acidobacteriota bacterium]